MKTVDVKMPPDTKKKRRPRSTPTGPPRVRAPVKPTAKYDPEPMQRALQLRSNSSLRTPSWRWDLARMFRERPSIAKLLRSRTDDLVRQIERFQIDLEGCHQRKESGWRERWPLLCDAYDLRYGPNQLRRDELEARLLAAESLERIQHRFALSSAEIVAWYERAFFNVSDRLDSGGWINAFVFDGLIEGSGTPSLGLIWKHYAYHGGSAVLDVLINATHSSRQKDKFGVGAKAVLTEKTKRDVLINSAIAMKFTPLDDSNRQSFLKLYLGQMKVESRAKSKTPGSDIDITPNLQAFLKAIGADRSSVICR